MVSAHYNYIGQRKHTPKNDCILRADSQVTNGDQQQSLYPGDEELGNTRFKWFGFRQTKDRYEQWQKTVVIWDYTFQLLPGCIGIIQ